MLSLANLSAAIATVESLHEGVTSTKRTGYAERERVRAGMIVAALGNPSLTAAEALAALAEANLRASEDESDEPILTYQDAQMVVRFIATEGKAGRTVLGARCAGCGRIGHGCHGH